MEGNRRCSEFVSEIFYLVDIFLALHWSCIVSSPKATTLC